MQVIVITVENKLYIYIMDNIQKQEVLSHVPKWNKYRHSLRVWSFEFMTSANRITLRLA